MAARRARPHPLPLFFLMIRPPPRSTLFPYPTLFRSSTEVSFGVPKDTLPGGSGVARLFALQYIHPQAITTNRRRISKRDQPRTPAQQTFFSPADLRALCASVVKSSSSATSSHALRRFLAVCDSGPLNQSQPLS